MITSLKTVPRCQRTIHVNKHSSGHSDKMPAYTCAVADCMSAVWRNPEKHPSMKEVKGWVRFPSVKKEPMRRKLWEERCKRGPGWRATRYHAVCSKHFRKWENDAPSTYIFINRLHCLKKVRIFKCLLYQQTKAIPCVASA